VSCQCTGGLRDGSTGCNGCETAVPPYCRTHGVRADDCECASRTPANGAEVLGDQNEPGTPQIATGEARTGHYDPLDQAHNEGARR